MTNKVLVPWSGGYDSTLNIIKWLESGYNIDYFYVELANNPDKAAQEKRAIAKLIPELKKLFKARSIISVDVVRCIDFGMLQLTVPLPQQNLWAFAAGLVYDSKQYYAFSPGFIRGDDYWHHKSDIESVLHSMQKDANISYLLEWFTKEDVLMELMDNYPTIYKFCWTCENPKSKTSKPCGTCIPCKKLKYALAVAALKREENDDKTKV